MGYTSRTYAAMGLSSIIVLSTLALPGFHASYSLLKSSSTEAPRASLAEAGPKIAPTDVWFGYSLPIAPNDGREIYKARSKNLK